MHTYVHNTYKIYTHIYIIHTYIHTYVTYIHTDIHAYIHIYIHTHTHLHMTPFCLLDQWRPQCTGLCSDWLDWYTEKLVGNVTSILCTTHILNRQKTDMFSASKYIRKRFFRSSIPSFIHHCKCLLQFQWRYQFVFPIITGYRVICVDCCINYPDRSIWREATPHFTVQSE